MKWPRCSLPEIYVTGGNGSWAVCGCGWKSRRVQHGASGASVAWSRHMADVARRRARLRWHLALEKKRRKARLDPPGYLR